MLSSRVARPLLPAPPLRPSLLLGGYVALYVALDWASYLYPVGQLGITIWNPPPGLSLALLLLGGLGRAPWLFGAAFLADVVVRGALHSPLLALTSSAVLAAGYTLLAAALLRLARIDPALRRLRDVVWLALAAVAGTGLVALAYVGLHGLLGAVARSDLPGALLRFWIGDALGVLCTTPFVLSVAAPTAGRWPSGRPPVAEVLGQLAALGLALSLVLWWAHPAESRLFYLLFLPVVWVAMRHGLRGATAVVLGVQAVLILVLWARGNPVETAIEFQLLMLALAATALFLAATVEERARTAEQLVEQQQELARALRLAAAGEVAASLAHELHQPLSAIAGYVKACRLLLTRGEGDRLPQTLDLVGVEVGRASEVVRRLRDFFRSGASSVEPIAVESLIAEAIGTLRIRAERHRVALTALCPAPCPRVSGDRVQLEIVLHNLLNNAIDAISRAGAPVRTVEVSARPAGELVEIRVADSGPGVSPQIASALFRPFATTKPEGMGLGLAMSRYIVEAHGGVLRLEPTPSGATFAFTLPKEPS